MTSNPSKRDARRAHPARAVLLTSMVMIVLSVVSARAGWEVIRGRVTDAATKQPLFRANVVVMGTGRGAYTDEEGRYEIYDLAPGTYQLSFSYVSYETAVVTDVVVKPSAPTIVNRGMVPSFIEAETIEVRPNYFADELDAPVSTVILAREEIRRFPGGFEDVVRTVATLPGVALVNSGGRNDLLVRGGGPSENLYLVNGLEVPNINHFGNQGSAGGALSFINLDFVDEVEFSTGGFGATYGDKMSSYLAIEMREGRTDRIGGKATISATQFGLELEGPVTGAGSFLFSARRSYLDFLFKALDQPFIPQYTDLNLSAAIRLSPNYQLTFLGLAALGNVERDLSTAENRVVNSTILDNSQDRWMGGARLRRLLDQGFVDLSLGSNQTKFDLAQGDTLQVLYFKSDALETEINARADAFLRFPEIFDLTLGVSGKNAAVDYNTAFADSVFDRSGRKVSREALDLPASIRGTADGLKVGTWVEVERRLGSRWRFTAGFRGDYYEFLERSFYPAGRFGGRYFVNDRLELKASHGTYYQSPSYVWLANGANRGLAALRNDMTVVGVDYLLRNDLSLATEFYYKDYCDLPAGATEATSYLVLTNTGVGFGGNEDDFQSFGFIPLESTGRGRAFGVDVSVQKKFSDTPFYGLVGLAVGKSEYDAPNGKTYPGQFDQPVIFSISGGYVLNPRWEFSAKFRAASGAPYTPVYDPATRGGQIQILPDEYLSARLGATHALDIRFDRRFAFDRWSMITFVDVQNVYNYRSPQRPTWDFWNREVVDRGELGVFPTIGISAEF